MQTLTHEQLKSMLDKREKFSLINVLGQQAFDEAHIPNSMSASVEEPNFVQQVKNLVKNPHEKVVVYCASFECNASTRAAQQLEQAGFDHVYDFEGGVRDWQEAGYMLEQGVTTH